MYTYAIKETHPQGFYKNIKTESVKSSEPTIIFNSHTDVPNYLKYSTTARRTIIYKLNQGTVLNLGYPEAFPQGPMHLHIAKGIGHLTVQDHESKERYQYTLQSRTSWRLSVLQLEAANIIIWPRNVHLVVMIEQALKEPNFSYPLPIPKSSLDRKVIKHLEKDKSYTIQRNELQKVIFLATRFAVGCQNQHFPIKIVIIERHLGLRMYTTVCPRHQIRNYDTPESRLSEKDVRHQMDHFWMYDQLKAIVKDAIIVGMDPYKQLCKLRISVDSITGIRNLKTSKIFDTGNMVKNPKWQLKYLITTVMKTDKNLDLKDPYVEAQWVEKIYEKCHTKWKDDPLLEELIITPFQQNTEKNISDELHRCINEGNGLFEFRDIVKREATTLGEMWQDQAKI